MQVLYLLDWAIIACSFFNTIALLWLGLTILLNAERRSWGTWLAGGGLVLGGLFYAGHSTVVGRVIGEFSAREMQFWWRVSWIPVVSAPYLWYVVMAWYSGVLRSRQHRIWLGVITLLGLAALALLRRSNLLPSSQQVIERAPVDIFVSRGIPVVAMVYPVYSILCIVLSLSALRRPEASERFMGDIARRRARPWLIGTSLILLAISLSFGAAIIWFLSRVKLRMPPLYFINELGVLMLFDLLVSGLGAVAIVLTGRAVVAYEIFTGKALPRGGLYLQWRRSIFLAACFGAIMAATLSIPPLTAANDIYRILLATVIMTVFFALLSWRTYTGRERSIDLLRPFIASQGIYERMLQPATPPELDANEQFRALCEDIVGAGRAYLTAVGPLAPLVGSPLSFPAELPAPDATGLLAQMQSPRTLCSRVESEQYGGAGWAVPLWSERGQIGLLLLGEKRDGGLYTQEEIEIARAAAERLIDTQASAEMARRLMILQRQRMAESQVVDRRTRRVLHDDVLPRIHTAMLMLSERQSAADQQGGTPETPGAGQPGAEQQARTLELLADIHRQIADLLHAMPAAAAPEVARLGLVGALRQMVEGELAGTFDGVTWQVDAAAEQRARQLPALSAEVIFYAAREVIRNAARYGRDGDPGRQLNLTVALQCEAGVELSIEDDGVGLGDARPSAGGSGRGLELHGTMLAVVGGALTAESVPGGYTRVLLSLPRAPWGSAT